MTRMVVFMLLLAAAALAVGGSPAAAAAPTIAEVREAYDAGKYQPALKMIAACLATKGEAAEGYDRYELLMLKGECLLQLKSNAYAANAFDDAKEATDDVGKRATALASALVVRKAQALKYVPRTGSDRAPIDVVNPVVRKKAMIALQADQMAVLKPKIDLALKADSLVPSMELLPQLREVAVLEYGSAGKVEELKSTLTALGTHARALIVRELKVKQAEVEELNSAANDIYWVNDYAARRGLHTDERKQLADLSEYVRRIEAVAHDGGRIAQLLGGDVQAWERISYDAGNLVIRIDSILNRPD